VSSLEATVQAKRDAAEKLCSFAGRCPLAPELIACRLSGQEVTELANQLAAEINTVDQEILSQDTEYVSLEAAIQALQQQINSLEQAQAKLPHPAGRAGRSHERKSRELINHLVVVHGLPIGSSPEPGSAGYFIIADEEDLEIATRSIKPRAIKIFRRARALEKLAQQMFNRQFTLLFKE